MIKIRHRELDVQHSEKSHGETEEAIPFGDRKGKA